MEEEERDDGTISTFSPENIVFSAKRYGVDALGAMAQGLFCTLLVGTILNTLGTQFHIGFLSATVVTVGTREASPIPLRGGPRP